MFVWFGRLCSIAIGIYSIFSFIKTLISNVVNCILLKRIGGGILDSCKFTMFPTTFILKNIQECQKQDNEELYLNNPLNNRTQEVNTQKVYPTLSR